MSRQRFPDEESGPQAHHQLSRAIDTPRIGVGGKPVLGQRIGGEPVKRTVALGEIPWMRDVVQLTGKHRSTTELWLLGSPPTSREVEPDAPL